MLNFSTAAKVGFFFDYNENIREEGNAADTELLVTLTGAVDIPVSIAMVPVNGTATGTFILHSMTRSERHAY